MELPRHRPDPTRPPTIWICGPRAYTLCTFLIKRYCNCGLTSKHHGLHYWQPPPLTIPILPLSRSHRSVPPPLPLSPISLIRSFIRSSFVHYRVRIKLPTCNRRYPPRGSLGVDGGTGGRRLTLRDAVTWSRRLERSCMVFQTGSILESEEESEQFTSIHISNAL